MISSKIEEKEQERLLWCELACDKGPLLVEVLGDTVQSRQVDDAQSQAYV
jgi:hypothetical protein